MASVTARYEYAEGGCVEVTVEAADSYPQSLTQACGEAVRGLVQALSGVLGEDE